MKIVKSYCELPFTRIRIDDMGGLNFCCYQGNRVLGNLKINTFDELWNCDLANEIRREVMGNHLHKMCISKECAYNYRNLDNKIETNTNTNEYPYTLEFSLHRTHCNYGGKNPDRNKVCMMCPRADIGFKEYIKEIPDITFELLNKLKPIFPYLRHFMVCGIAELFWEDKIFDVLDYVEFEKYKNRIKFECITNGSLFNNSTQIKLLEKVEFSHITFSLDAATSKTYKQIRKNNYFDTILKNIKLWTDRIDNTNHFVSISANVNMINIGEMPDLIRLAKQLNVDNVCIFPTHDADGCNTLMPSNFRIGINNYKLFRKIQNDCITIGKKIGVTVHFEIPLDLNLV